MSPLALLKRSWPWARLALLCALIAFAAAVAPSKIGRMEFEREALAAADRIGARLNGEPSALIDAFAKPALAPHISRIFDELGYGNRVFRYELYDNAGNLTFTSGRAGLQLDHDLADARTPPQPPSPTYRCITAPVRRSPILRFLRFRFG